MTLRERRGFPAGRRAATAFAAVGTALASTLLMAPSAHAADSDITWSNVVWNNNKPIVVGTGAEVRNPLTYTVKTSVKLESIYTGGYRGTWGQYGEDRLGAIYEVNCPQTVAGGYTFYNCKNTVMIDPANLVNSDAGTWKTFGTAIKPGGGFDDDLLTATVSLRRASLIEGADAGPEPVTKGQPITIKGTLKRANWSTHRYDLYGGQKAVLQFKAAGTTTWTYVKTVTTSTTGALKTTVTAAKDGTWRWYYAGNSITGAKATTGDYVDVR